MGIKDVAVGRKDIFIVPIDELVVKPGFNPRIEGEDLDAYIRDLADYIKEFGVPGVLTITTEDGQPIIINGHCRYRASRIAIDEGTELKGLPCMMMDRYANDVDKIAALVVTNNGRGLEPLELAEVAKRLHNLGLKNVEIAKRISKSAGYVGSLLELAAADQKTKEEIKNGEKKATHVMKPKPVNKMKLIREIIEAYHEKTDDPEEILEAIISILKPKKRE